MGSRKAADVRKKDVWDFQAFSQTLLELRFSFGNEGKDGKNLNSQTWPETPKLPSPRHPRPPDMGSRNIKSHCFLLPGQHCREDFMEERSVQGNICPKTTLLETTLLELFCEPEPWKAGCRRVKNYQYQY